MSLNKTLFTLGSSGGIIGQRRNSVSSWERLGSKGVDILFPKSGLPQIPKRGMTLLTKEPP